MLIPLIHNETLKLLRRRRFAIICGIMFVILVLVSYSQYRQLRQMKNANWRADLQERIARAENRLRRGQINASWARSMRAEIRRLQFYLDRGINPEQPTAPLVVRTFANAAGFLLLPLLIAVLGRSEEHTSELQSRLHLVCRLLLEKKKNNNSITKQSHYN